MAHQPPHVFLTEVNFVSRFALLFMFRGELDMVLRDAIIVNVWLKKFKLSCGKKSESWGDEAENNAVLIQCLCKALDDTIRKSIVATSSNAEEDKVRIKERHKVELDDLMI
jgi:hypothetical protein